MLVKIKIVILFFLITISSAFSMTEEELKDYTYIDFYNFVSSYNILQKNYVDDVYGDKKIEYNYTNRIFMHPPAKYIAFLEYRNGAKRLNTYQRPFLLDWFKLSKSSNVYSDDSTPESILADQNFELFYISNLYSSNGRTYFITTQKAISEKMQKELKIGELIKVYIWNIGQVSNNEPYFIVVGYEKTPSISNAIKDELFFKDYFPKLKNDIFNREYDKAKGNIQVLLKKYPNNIDLKLNLCLINSKTGRYSEAISCYDNIAKLDPKNYNAYYGMAMARYESNNKNESRAIIDNTTKALTIVGNLTDNTKGTMSIIAINCYYLRAMAKANIGDKTAIDDFIMVNELEPTVVSSDVIDIYRKELGL